MTMSQRVAVLFQTHYFDRGSARVFERLRRQLPKTYEAFVLIHVPPGAPVPPRLAGVPHHVARTPELRYPAYPTKCGGADWNLWNGGHTDLILLHFFRSEPDFDRYWIVEYDVRFSGSWGRFFRRFEEMDADMLVPGLRSRAHNPEWMWWRSFLPPDEMADEAQLCSFMPVYRVSRAGILAVDAAWRAGWAGHSEAVWPTAIAAAGLSVSDLGGDGPFTPPELRGRFYSSTPNDLYLSPGTLLFKPPLYRAGSRPDMLWHPVKPFWPRAELRQGVRDVRVDLGLLRRRLFAAGRPRFAARGNP